MNIQIIKECTQASLEGTITFPEVVRRLAETGVISYHVDLVLLEKTTYGPETDHYRHTFTLDQCPAIAEEFKAEEVVKAIRDIQEQKIKYVPFLHRIMAAGVTHYEVFIQGKKAIYTSRHGDFHIENFPQ